MEKASLTNVILFVMLLTGCSISKRSSCIKQYMNNQKFIYIASDGHLDSKYFLIKDSLQFEYSDGNLYSESLVDWVSCNEYNLIIKRTYYKEAGLQPGDTLFVKLHLINKDTAICTATAYNHTFSFKVLKDLTKKE